VIGDDRHHPHFGRQHEVLHSAARDRRPGRDPVGNDRRQRALDPFGDRHFCRRRRQAHRRTADPA
jgi:hypothetical protein